MRSMKPLLCFCLALGTLLALSTVADAQQPRRIKPRTKVYKEPAADMGVPVTLPGAKMPESKGPMPVDAQKLNRTGTYGGTIVYSVVGEVETFNPVEPKGVTSQECRRLLFSSLVGYNNGEWKVESQLAKSWEVSEDHRTWTFTLRQGVLFSDGHPVDIEDVEFSFMCIFDERYPSSIQSGFRNKDGNLPTMKVVDEHRIQFTSQYIDSQFLTHIGNVMVIPKHKWWDAYDSGKLMEVMTNDMDPKEMVGCGPFILKEYTPAERVVLARNPYYWRVDARGNRLPYLDRVILAIVKDLNFQWQKFEAGEHDVIDDMPVDHYKEAVALEKADKGAYELCRLGVSLNSYWITLNLHPGKNEDTGEPFVDPKKAYWFNNMKFRHALNHAFDRGSLVKVGFEGRGKPIWSSFTPGNKLFAHKDVVKFEHSADKANELLDELGWKDSDGDGYREDDRGNRIEFNLNTNVENNIRQQMGTLVVEHFKKIGVKLNFRPITFNNLVTSLRDSHDFEAILLGWGSGVPPDPANGKNITTSNGRLHCWYPMQPEPATPWEARVDELMGMMDMELEHDVRKKYNDEIQDLIAFNCPIFYLVAPNAYAMGKTKVGNLWPSLLRPRLTWNIDELYMKEPKPQQ